jgi:nucleoid DNA-binding protein
VTNDEQPPINLNKASLADAVADRMGLARSVAYEAVENVFDICAQAVAQGRTVSITNFASMDLVTKRSRWARNPHTGERIQVPSRRAIRIKVSPRLNEFANSKNPALATIRKQAKGPSRK